MLWYLASAVACLVRLALQPKSHNVEENSYTGPEQVVFLLPFSFRPFRRLDRSAVLPVPKAVLYEYNHDLVAVIHRRHMDSFELSLCRKPPDIASNSRTAEIDRALMRPFEELSKKKGVVVACNCS